MYFQHPTLYGNDVVFVCNDSLWRVGRHGGRPERLTESMEKVESPVYSLDGKTLAFSAFNDLYCLSAEGGIPQRITYTESPLTVLGWTIEGKILICSGFQGQSRQKFIYEVSPQDGIPHKLSLGPCEFISHGPLGRKVLQRGGYGYISWKRYKGGTAGRLWIDREGNNNFIPLLKEIPQNLLRPLWIQDRIYFLSDYEGKGNIYSCALDGTDVQRHTHHSDFYVRQNSTDGRSIVYSCGGDLYLLEEGRSQKIELMFAPGPLDKVRKTKNPAKHLTSYALSPQGNQLALTTRGRLFQLTPHKGPLFQRGKRDGIRYRLTCWLKDNRLVALCDRLGKSTWELYQEKQSEFEPVRCVEPSSLDWGAIISVKPSPCDPILAFINHRQELVWLHLDTGEEKVIAHSPKGPISGYDWSPCGRWVVYSLTSEHIGLFTSRYKGNSLWVYDTHHHQAHRIMSAEFKNVAPVFDAEGKYIYFFSARSFNPQWDDMQFNMFFEDVMQPFALVLQQGEESPFMLPLLGKGSSEQKIDEKEDVSSDSKGEESKDSKKPVEIDFEGISERIIAFPVPTRTYLKLASIKGQVLYTVEGEEHNELYSYDLASLREERLISNIDSFTLSADGQWMMYYADKKLRLIKAGAKPDDSPDSSFYQGGWVDWSRVPLVISPQHEWRQMFDEAWRLQRDFFWTPRMGQINWDEVYQRYRPCIERATCRAEVLSIIADMHGELGTSHAYILGLQNKESSIGSLGAEFAYDQETGAYRITRILKGDIWKGAPLCRPGLNVKEGDLVWAIRGQPLSREVKPSHLLDHQAGQIVPLVVSDSQGQNKRTIMVIPFSGAMETAMRYREWVEGNRRLVREKSGGRAGYIHIPDMGEEGYAEFIRSFMQEFDHDGLIVDARFNFGGNVSPLILDLLTRKRTGYDKTRHQGLIPYPYESPKGPIVGLVNEYTCSDGDIFAQNFRSLNLGPLVGKRTWGGVVGIWPRYDLIDGTLTSQPEYSFWFHDVGWKVENHGVEPTIEVEIAPQDYMQERDPQLERAIEELALLIERDAERQKQLETPPEEPCLSVPDFDSSK